MIAAASSSNLEIRNVRKIDAGAEIIAAHFIGDHAGFVLGEEVVVVVAPDGRETRVPAHAGAILSIASSDDAVITGGDDGRVVATTKCGANRVVATDAQHRWIDSVAVSPVSVAWSAGKQAYVMSGSSTPCCLDVGAGVTGVSFAAGSRTVAISHYGGVTLWEPWEDVPSRRLDYKGAHLDVRFSPRGNFIVTRMRESALHGWRLQDRREMPMHGYTTRVHSVDWTPGGKWLATSGSRYLVLWPFEQAETPLTGVPILLAGYRAESTVVSCHPHEEIVAIGYEDGMVLLVRIEDEAEILIKQPAQGAVSSLAWNREGDALAIACAGGVGRIVEFAGGSRPS